MKCDILKVESKISGKFELIIGLTSSGNKAISLRLVGDDRDIVHIENYEKELVGTWDLFFHKVAGYLR